jgi:hypothetical protein
MKRSFFLFISLLIISSAQAQLEKYQAAYLYQFTKLIDWCPAYKTGEFVIMVIGESSIISELQTLAQTKKVVNQSIVVKKVQSSSEISEAQLVFITSDKANQLSGVLSKIGSKCTLVISEKEGGARNGAAISFIETGGKIYFDLNKGFFNSHSLGLNSQLAALAKNSY